MLRINFLEFYVFILHEINFVCSPISNKRFENEYRQRLKVNYVQKSEFLCQNVNRTNCDSKIGLPDDNQFNTLNNSKEFIKLKAKNWTVLLKPIELFKLVKRFHQAKNRFIFLFLLHNLFCIHIAIKTIIHACFNRDRNMIEYFRKIHYPHLSERSDYNTMFLVLSVSVLIVRLRSSYILIKQSILNADKYNELCTSQITLADLTWWNFTFDEWKRFYNFVAKHKKDVKSNNIIRDEHYKFDQNIQKQIPYHCQLDLMYYINVTDFNECYKRINLKIARKRKYLDWHCAKGSPRLSLDIVALWTVLFTSVCLFILILISVTIIGIVYFDLRSSFSKKEESNWNCSVYVIYSKFYDYYTNDINNTIRVIELWLLILLQIPQHFDASFAFLNILVIIERTKKLMKSFDCDLKFCRDKAIIYSIVREQIHLNRKQHEVTRNFSNNTNGIASSRSNQLKELIVEPLERSKLNRRLQHNVKLAELLFLEFVDIKKAYTSLFNVLIIGNGICLSYLISLFFKLDNLVERCAMSAVIFSSTLPIMGAMLVCALVEKTVSFIGVGYL